MSETNTGAIPRFEFRAFAQCFGGPVDRLRELSRCDSIEEIEDIYLVSAVAWRYNVKIRNNQLNIKKLIEERGGLELWEPWLKLDFPAGAAEAGGHVFRSLALPVPDLGHDPMILEAFLKGVIVPDPQITIGEVFKRRFHFRMGNCPVEVVEMRVNGAAIQSMAVEGEEEEDVLETCDMLGLQGYENLSYIRVMRRIMGHEAPVRRKDSATG